MKSFKNGLTVILTASWFLSCAYFNTFYNAQQYFKEAEEDLLKNQASDKLSKKTDESLAKAIDKCNTVLSNFPESRWRDDALLLKGKAQYYRGSFSIAKATLERLNSEHPESDLVADADLWLVRCRWKLGEGDASLDALLSLITEPKESKGGSARDRLALGHQMAGDIYIERQQLDSALWHYGISGDYARSSSERSNVYYRVGELAFENLLYNYALDNYRKVIDLGGDAKQVEKAHLQIVRITRLEKQWDQTVSEVQNLLSNDKFIGIRADLHLELAKLYETQSNFDDAISRYRLITEEFPKTLTSAEAYYHLGIIALQMQKDYGQARKYFDSVVKEKRASIYAPSAKAKKKEIDDLLTASAEVERLEAELSEIRGASRAGEQITVTDNVDGSETDSIASLLPSEIVSADTAAILNSLDENLYAVGELLAFHFAERDSGVRVFERLLKSSSSNVKRPQALYALSQLYAEMGDTSRAIELADLTMADYPDSEYAGAVAASRGIVIEDAAADLLKIAETQQASNPEAALKTYAELVRGFPSSRFVPLSLLATATIYDRQLNDMANSLLFYSKLIEQYPETEQAQFARSRYDELTLLQISLTDTIADTLSGTDEN